MEELLSSFSGTITPWLLSIFVTLSLLTLLASLKNWREMKRSPYFFQRLQATKRLQTYLATSALLFVITAGVTIYAWQEPQDTSRHMAILTHSKPDSDAEDIAALPPLMDKLSEEAIADFQLTEEGQPGQLLTVADQALASTAGTLPAEFDQFEPKVELTDASDLGALTFSTEINDEYEAVDPREIFPEGFYTLYATFSYDGLADGMVWSWVWRLDGQVVEGGNEVWNYGDEGPGYIYFSPEEGFDTGRYSLEVWVNGELLTQAAIVMNSVSVSANN